MKKIAGGLIAAGVLAFSAYAVRDRDETQETVVFRSVVPAATPALAPAESLYWAGEHEAAQSAWRAALTDPAIALDSARVADVMTWLGTVAWKLSEYDEARELGEAALALKQRLRIETAYAKSYNSLGLLAWNEGRLADALGLFRDGLKYAPVSGDPVIGGKLASNIGLIETEFARYDRARQGFGEALRVARAAGDAKLEANALSNLAMLDVRTDAAASAIPRLHLARQIYARINYVAGEQNALGQLSTAYGQLSDLQRAFAALDSADMFAQRHGLKREAAANLEVRGDLYRDAGDLGKALQQYARAQDLNRELGLEVERGTVLRKSALTHRELGATSASQQDLFAAAEIHARAGARLEEFRDRLLLGADVKQMQRARALARAIGTPAARAEIAVADARAALDADPPRAFGILQRDSLSIVQAGFDLEAEAAVMRAVALARTGEERASIAAAKAAADALERARLTLGSSLLRASFVAHRAALYGRLIDLELTLERPREAFRMAELAREVTASRVERTDNAALLRVRELTMSVNALAVAVSSGDTTMQSMLDMLDQELTDARADYESVLARTASSQKGVSKATASATIETVSAALRPDEALLEFFFGGDDVYAFVLTKRGLRAQKLELKAPALMARLRIARSALAEPNGAGGAIMASLHDALIGPFAEDLRAVKRLVVVPHAALTYLPFAALRDGTTGRYLIESHTIQYLPAAVELPRLRSALRGALPRAVVLQPFPKQLPGTRAEAKAIRRALRGTKTLKAEDATVEALRALLERDVVVHVSSHAAMDAQTPLFSHVALARANDDGRFEIHDVLASQVRSPLVFLSGCETGLGGASITGRETGADASTFARAFLGAGARGIVSTLWRIEDASAPILAGSFYRELRSTDGAEALARAQRELLRSPRYRNPFHWAAYVLTGDVGFSAK